MEQQLKFLSPVYFGDTVTAEVEIIECINPKKNIIRLATRVRNQEKVLVIDGYAIVKAPGHR